MNSSQPLLRKPSVDIRCAANVLIASGCTDLLGRLPAGQETNRPATSSFIKPSAGIDRAEFPVRMNRTLPVSCFITPQQHVFDDFTAMGTGLPRGAGVQQADDSTAAAGAGVQQAGAVSVA